MPAGWPRISVVVGAGAVVGGGATVDSVVVVVSSVVGGSSTTAEATEPIDNTDAAATVIAPTRVRSFPTDARMGVDTTGNDVSIVTEPQTTPP